MSRKRRRGETLRLQHRSRSLSELAPTVTRILRVFHGGSSSPCLVETDSGALFVMKLAGAGPGPRALIAEFLAAWIAGSFGVPVPAVSRLFLPRGFPWQVGTDEFDDTVQRSHGWNLGSAFVPDARDLRADDLDGLPAPFRARLRTLDRFLQNVDRTRQNPNILRGADGRLWAIDHGACLYLERIAAGRRPFPFTLPPNHFLAARPREPDLAAPDIAIDRAALRALVAGPPESWIKALSLSRFELARRLSDYFDAFRRAGP